MVTLTNYMDSVSVFLTGDTDQEVVWLDIAVDQRLVVNRLDAGDL